MQRGPVFLLGHSNYQSSRSSAFLFKFSFCLLLLVSLFACGGGGSATGPSGGSAPATLYLLTQPASPTVYAGTTFLLKLTASVSGSASTPSVTLGSLPAGLTTTDTFPMSIPSGGQIIGFQVDPAMAAGSYNFTISGTAGSATAQTSIAFTVAAGTPSAMYFTQPLYTEIGLAPGSSLSLQFRALGSSLYAVSLSARGLPAGTTATFSSPVVQTGDTFTVTLTAAASAPVAHNVEWSVLGTPISAGAAAVSNLLLDINGPASVGWTNRTDYVWTRATPFSATYDPFHQLIFSSNQTWNRIDVISGATHSVVSQIPVRDPRGVDLSPDGTRVWVATGSQVMYSIDTTTLKATRYLLPRYASITPGSWEGSRVFSLADGTVLLSFSAATGGGSSYVAIWDPASNTLTPAPSPGPSPQGFPASWSIITRSADGKHIFSVGGDSAEVCFSYDVSTKTLSNPVQLTGYAYAAYASPDGSKIAIRDAAGFNLYDGNFNFLTFLPGDGGNISDPSGGFIQGGTVFSADGRTIYEETELTRFRPSSPSMSRADIPSRLPRRCRSFLS